MTFSMRLTLDEKDPKKVSVAPVAPRKKQYGLVLPKSKAKKTELVSACSAFTEAAESSRQQKTREGEQSVRTRVGAEAARSLQQSQVDQVRAQALAEDASVFDYDGVYDDMKKEREREARNRKTQRTADKEKPKYIGTLLQQAKIREVENQRIRERRLLHERQADDALYGDKEKLVSVSYKRKLQEMQNWDAEDARLAALEEREDVTKQGEHAMAGFYANLNKNIAMGGTTTNARSAYTVKEARSASLLREEPIRAKRGLGRDDEHDSESVETSYEVVTEKVSSGNSLDENHTVSTCDTLFRQEEANATTDIRPPPPCILDEAKPSKEDAISAAKARFLARKAQRKSSSSQH
uniref:Nuclear speckle splicing regulatory protein 1 N-terminal domain-containing protein n=1 Tax=Peronospora matthiolae TaxID=2874970 RepID=A0AAV1TX24_9STRA